MDPTPSVFLPPTDQPPTGSRILLAYSGGLDTSFLVAWLTHARGYKVTTLTVDCGGLDRRERATIEARALSFGAKAHRSIDGRTFLYERVLRWLIAGNVRRGGTYPLCVAAERGLQAELLAQNALEGQFDGVAHGCTGAGNDQVRFEGALSVVADGLLSMAPIRDFGFSRQDEVSWLIEQGLQMPGTSADVYSLNQGLWGISIGGKETLNSRDALPEEAWILTAKKHRSSGSRTIQIDFTQGAPVALNGASLDPVALIEQLNQVAGSYGVGRGYHLGDTILGHKGRIGYEAPAAETLLTAHAELEKLVLTEDQRAIKDVLSNEYGRRLHGGLAFEPLLRDIESFFASTQTRVTGSVRVRLEAGQALVVGLDSPFSMMDASDAVYGERPAAFSDPRGAVWLARTKSEPARLWQRAGEQADRLPQHTLQPASPSSSQGASTHASESQATTASTRIDQP